MDLDDSLTGEPGEVTRDDEKPSRSSPLHRSYQLLKVGQEEEEEDELTNSQQVCVSPLDDDYLQPHKNKLPPLLYHKWRKAALIVEYVSIVVAFALAIGSFATSELSDSTSLLGLSFDSLLAIFSSSCIIWRFSKPVNDKKGESLDIGGNPRERKACFAVGVAFVFSAVLIFVDSVRSLIVDNEPTQPESMVITSSVGAVLLGILFYAKYTVADKLESRAMKTDAFDSAAGAITALSIIACTVIDSEDNKFWFLDEVVAIFIGVTTFVYGVQTLHMAVKGGKKTAKK